MAGTTLVRADQLVRFALSLSLAARISRLIASHCASPSCERPEKFPEPPRCPAPSMAMAWPVRYSQPSAIRNTARLASSTISPLRPIGIRPPTSESSLLPPAWGLRRSHAPLGGNGPGAMAFSRMPFGPHSVASDLIMMLTPALAMAEGTVNGPPFQIQVVRIEITLAFCPAAIQRLPQAKV